MTNTKTNAQRGRPMVTITLSPEGLAELDKRRGTYARGEYIECLLEDTREAELDNLRVLRILTGSARPKPKRRRVKK